MTEPTITDADWQKAVAETNRLQRELDITNADHIALWIEANTIPDEPMNQCASWLACRIVEAHEASTADLRAVLRECEQTFRFYEQNHLAKGTQDGDEKAYRNKQMADKCAAALGGQHEA